MAKKVKVSKRKFYRTVFELEVLSEEPVPDGQDLKDILAECETGGYSGHVCRKPSQRLDAPTVARLLRKQGSDPGFFRLTKKGEDCED